MSQLTVEQVAEAIDKFSPDEREQVRQKLEPRKERNGLAFPPGSEVSHIPPTAPVKDIKREMAWIEAHRDEYSGQWVALDGDRLIKAGTSAKEVHNAAKAEGVPLALIVRV